MVSKCFRSFFMTVTLLAPLILLSSLGWGLVKFRLVHPSWVEGTGDLTTKLLIPSLLFMGTYQNGFPEGVSLSLLAAYYLPFLLLFAVMVFVFRRHPYRAQISFSTVYANTVLVGIPVVVQVAGEAGLQYAFPVIAFHSLIGFSLYYATGSLQASSSKRTNALTSLTKTLQSPIVLSLLLGLFANELGVPLPALFTQTLSLLGDAALPCALLVLGASLTQLELTQAREAPAIVLVKLLVLPALVLASSLYVFRLPLEVTTVLLVLASGPVGINAYILALSDKTGVALVSSATLAANLLYILSLPLWLGVLGFLT